MMYLLDANVLIDANRDFYPINAVSEFWEWLIFMGESGDVKIPIEIYEELEAGVDELSGWVKNDEAKKSLVLDEDVDISLIHIILDEGYAKNLSDSEIEQIGRDPFLLAYALLDNQNRMVVTTESSRPSKQRANRHVPDVCNHFNIPWCNTFTFTHDLCFSTKWNNTISK